MKTKGKKSAGVMVLRIVGLGMICAGIVMMVMAVKDVLLLLSAINLQSGEWTFDWSQLRGAVIWLSVGVGLEFVGGIVMGVARSKQRKELQRQSSMPVAGGEAMALLTRLGITDKNGNLLARAGQSTPATVMASVTTRTCAQCGKSVDDNAFVYCPYCAAALPKSVRPMGPAQCMYCGSPLKQEEDICPQCGHKVVKNEQV